MKFTDLFIKRPVLALVVSLLILLLGLRSLSTLPIRQYPKLSSTTISITTVYPGATADLMQGFITTPIEQAVASADGIDYMTSNSVQGQSTVTVYVKLNYDPSQAMTDVIAKVQQVKYLIPKEANDPVITKSTGDTTAVMYLSFASKELPGSAISDYLTRVVQPLIATVDGVASADILGGQTFAMRLWLDPARMAARGVSADDVANALRNNNVQSAPGQVKGLFTVSNVTADTDLTSVEDFRRMVVKASGGAVVRLEDVASISLGAQNTNSAVMFSGLNAVFIGVQVTPTGNPLQMVQNVREKILPEIQRNLPPAIEMKVAYDATNFINASISEVEHTLIEAIVIVIIIIFLFLGSLRSVLIPVVTIPLSLIGAFTLMLAAGFSLNLLTLLAMVLAIGLVVDDAIVVVENVYRHLEEGKTPVQAALVGAREIAGPVIAMTITLAAVYAPIGLLGGVTGALFREFAFTLAGAVVISGVVALTLSPMMASVLLPKGGDHTAFSRFVDRAFNGLANFYERRLTRALDYRPVILLFAVVVLASIPYLYLHGRSELAPEEDQGILFSVFKGPQYANIDYTQHYAQQLDAAGGTLPEGRERFLISGTTGTSQGIAGVLLKPWGERDRPIQQSLAALQAAFNQVPGEKALVFNLPPLPGTTGGLPVQMVLNGTQGFPALYEAMDKIKAAAVASHKFLVVDSDLDYNTPVVRIHIDRSKANEMGVTMASIGDTLALMVGENYVNRFNLQGRSYEVIPQVPRIDRLTPDKLTRFYVTSVTGDQVPLSTFLRLEEGTDPNALTHYNQMNSATFQAVPMPGVSMGEAVAFLEDQVKQLPAGYSHSYLSQTRQFVEEGNQLAMTFGFALIVIFLVLAAQFESLRDPLVIMVSVPMSICGALIPLFIGITSINIYTQVGLVTLIGLISKHGILLVEFANEMQVKEGLGRREAILHAARVRLRPILMTTAAMVVGLLPLLIASGAGAASRFSIGLVVVTGMSIGTLFTLFVLPAVYTLLAKDHKAAASSRRLREIAEVA
ncbi:multidrug efflux RND transporter permease subunit [Nitrospirillum amazonense]|uniref:Multidrug efflux pump n=1 Tax=Nitrospirillum amazonense TaxID=28077 RepID=A0A560JE20_9PROT|nr:multidrug efflux RND transporter permease subunit [Nitrospirillum amazonense]MDG3438901.1 multidrug efflux RND transporter permease subunit [Nitrospirillum amazonense]TWB69296.1 multidrug efflux pump [Nitrospirillum amazonense]